MQARKKHGLCRRLVALCAVSAVCVCARGADTVWGVVCIHDLKGLGQKVAALADKIMPGMGNAVAGNQAGFLALPGWADIDTTKPASVVFLSDSAKDEPDIAVIMSALEGKKVTALPWPDGTNVAVEMRDNYVVVGMRPGVLKTVTAKRAAAYGVWPASAGEADIYATFAVGGVLGPLAESVSSGVDLIDGLKAPVAGFAARQVSRVSLTLSLSGEALDIGSRVYAVPKSALGDFLTAAPPAAADLAKFLPGDCPAAVIANVNWAKLTPLVNLMWDECAAPLELGDDVKRILFGSLAVWGQQGPVAAGVSGNPAHAGMQAIAVLSVADAARFRAAAKDYLATFGKSDAKEGPGAEYKEGLRDRGGVKVDRALVTPFKAPGSESRAAPRTVEIAAAQSVGVVTNGNDKGDLMDGVLDLVGKGGASLADAPAYKAAVAAAPKDASAVFHLTFTKLVAKLAGEVQQQAPFIAPFLSPFTEEIPGEQPITGYARCAAYAQGPAVNVQVRVPTMLVAALGQRIATLMQMFGGGGKAQPPKKTAPPPAEEEPAAEEEKAAEEEPAAEEEKAGEEEPAAEEEKAGEEEEAAEEAPGMEEEADAGEETPAEEEKEDAGEETPAEEDAGEK